MLKVQKSVLVILVVFFIGACTCSRPGLTSSSNQEPSDNSLRKYFLQEKVSLERLKDMMSRHKSLTFVAPSRLGQFHFRDSKWYLNDNHVSRETVSTATGVSSDEMKLYDQLLAQTNIQSISVEQGGQTKFLVWRSTPPPKPALEEKFFVFCNQVPSSLEADTGVGRPTRNDDQAADRKQITLYSPIEKNWFISFVRYGNIPPRPPLSQ